MRLLVGLGNPGPRYQATRHNIGFMALDAIARRHELGAFRKRFQGELAAGSIGREQVLALKPQTYMNESGIAVGQAMRYYKLTPGDVIVLYDEVDLRPGKLRAKFGGGAAGHNGIRSITAHIGADFWRVRLGVGHPGKDRVHGHVLSGFSKADHDWLDPLLDAVADAIGLLLAGEDAKFMSRVALLTAPPKAEAEPGADAKRGGDADPSA
jgi:PTH1 family peptidyl-tRNA hydrolase